MTTTPTFSTLWAVNGPLEISELCRQLDDFAAAGLDGIVFHPRFYPDRPEYLGAEYLDIVSRLIIEADARGLAFWIYDENGWPSGTVGGEMLRRHPELRQRWLEMQPDRGQLALTRFDHAGREWALVVREGEGVDYLAADLAGRFLELAYERYARGLSPEAFAKVAGFFSDEPEFGLGHAQHDLSPYGAVPWTSDLAERFRERHGEDLVAIAPRLFVDGDGAAITRVRFWELVTDLFSERYLARIDDWCRSHGVRFTAHVKGEEHPLFQLPTVGSLGAVSRAIGTPGIDALGRVPGNDFYPRQCSSVARQFGDGRAMAEVFGGAGWGAAPIDLERNLRWLGGHGITDFVLHLSQYRLDSAAIEDWPPSHPRHVSWAGAYREVIAQVREALRIRPRPDADTLVIVPQRALAEVFEPWEFVATNVHDAHDFPSTAAGAMNAAFLALVERLSAAGVECEFADERTLERYAQVDSDGIRIGASRYRRVVAAEGVRLEPQLTAALRPLLVAVPTERRAPASPPSGMGSGVVLRPEWRVTARPLNELVLEPIKTADGSWSAVVESSGAHGAVELRFADDLTSLAWGAEEPAWSRGVDGSVARVSLESGRTEVRFRTTAESSSRPRMWLAGGFRVVPLAYERGESATRLLGPFRLLPEHNGPLHELVEEGYPFAFEPLELSTVLQLPPDAQRIVVSGGRADAALLRLGDGDPVWRWSADGWDVDVPAGASGEVVLQLALVPSSFNRYGPHHHYIGDPQVVSPAQMRGERNYADRDEAPHLTHVSDWWVRRAVAPDAVHVHVAGPWEMSGVNPLTSGETPRKVAVL
ncbi:hypothetical protein [Microbacterium stercoris]|uniref:Uncharacterized protein n=1 Tax=Microbacterium stercoris TaxID=2820289 RepID=A0A939TPM6_9MICO|nr:hypothetical protein [Microbacterium stercoris]MBO3662236.1 hypothetical protein [Microbacterium stercoris]